MTDLEIKKYIKELSMYSGFKDKYIQALKECLNLISSQEKLINQIQDIINEYPVKTLAGNNCIILSKTDKDYQNFFKDLEEEFKKEHCLNNKINKNKDNHCIEVLTKYNIDDFLECPNLYLSPKDNFYTIPLVKVHPDTFIILKYDSTNMKWYISLENKIVSVSYDDSKKSLKELYDKALEEALQK